MLQLRGGGSSVFPCLRFFSYRVSVASVTKKSSMPPEGGTNEMLFIRACRIPLEIELVATDDPRDNWAEKAMCGDPALRHHDSSGKYECGQGPF